MKHLEPKILAKHSGDRQQLQSQFWMCGATAMKSAADAKLAEMKETHPDAHEHLTNLTYTGKDGKEKRGVTEEMWMNSQSKGKSWGKMSSSGVEAQNSAMLKLEFRRMPPPIMMKSTTAYIEKRIIKLGEKVAKYE